ncbi:MAG TPA: ABC transporter permease [Bacillota bacterium]|nr:ABC transporter permease [Bacillota bacterium]
MSDMVRRFGKNRLALVSLAVFAVIALVAILAPHVAPYNPDAIHLGQRLRGPSPAHLLGTDSYGRDVLSRVIYGARVSLEVGFIAGAISLGLGTALGATGAYFGGAVDLWVTRCVDVFMSLPALFLILVIVALFGSSVLHTMVVIGVVAWPPTARIVRSEVLSLRKRDFAEAARAQGAGSARIILRHMLPSALPSVIVQGTLFVAQAILLESGLSYLGLGVQPPTPSWGNMLVDGRLYLAEAWWIATFPGLAIFATVFSLNFIGDGLRDATSPQHRV